MHSTPLASQITIETFILSILIFHVFPNEKVISAQQAYTISSQLTSLHHLLGGVYAPNTISSPTGRLLNVNILSLKSQASRSTTGQESSPYPTRCQTSLSISAPSFTNRTHLKNIQAASRVSSGQLEWVSSEARAVECQSLELREAFR